MFCERLELTDFRGYAELRVEFAAPLGLLAGANAQGKTNLLEAVAVLALGRSPRTTRDGDLVRRTTSEAFVRADIRRSRRDPVSLALGIGADGAKQAKVDGVRRRLAEFVGELAVVLFLPDDLALVSGGPERRRSFLNATLGQTSRRYLAALATYRQVIRQRNELLRGLERRGLDESLLLAYDDHLAEQAAVLMAERLRRTGDLNREAAAVHRHLSGGAEALAVRYEPNVPLPESPDEGALADAVREQLIAARSAELRRRITLVGPHRDDLRLEIDGRPARAWASQGQQRTAALALKIGELRTVAAELGEPPLLLLDDVMSELDPDRRRAVLGLAEEAEQVLITASDASLFDRGWLARAELFEVSAGALRRVGGEP